MNIILNYLILYLMISIDAKILPNIDKDDDKPISPVIFGKLKSSSRMTLNRKKIYNRKTLKFIFL